MLPAVAIMLGVALSTGGTVGLAPDDPIVSDPASEVPGDSGEPSEDGDSSSGVPGLAGFGVIAALLALSRREGEDLSPSGGLGLEASPLTFVFVPGHGQAHGRLAFDALIENMGLSDDSVRYFDYRWVEGGANHSDASEDVPIDDAVSALNAYLAGVAAEGEEVYLVGFSKGGATIAELIADWDDGRWGPADSIRGAALLDPPMAVGAHGWMQSAGRAIGPIPDDGGYDPVQCSFIVFGCEDRRDHLGVDSGVDVVVVRNPRAAITSFSDLPEGLRVYDAADEGPGPWGQLLRNPLGFPGRVAEAHEAVLGDPRVAACLVAESTVAGTCQLPLRDSRPPLPGLRGSPVRPPAGQKVV